MNFFSILVIALGLGMDAFSVALTVSAVRTPVTTGQVLRMSGAFGVFQFIMPLAGWIAGRTVADIIAGYDHWIAFILLACVGGKMIWESFSKGDEIRVNDPTKGWMLLMLAVATSIDALAVGLSFAFLKVSIIQASSVIGIAAFVMTMTGMAFGHRMGRFIGKRMETMGGLVLIGIGLKLLLEHL